MEERKHDLEMIVAIAKGNNGIGLENKLLWDIKEDMKHFKNVTMGKTVVMGANTFLSIGRLLPGRKNVVLTSNPSKFNVEGLQFASSVEEVLELSKNEDVIIIGGDSIYKQFIDHADVLHVTEVEGNFEADTFFPEIDSNKWACMLSFEGRESTEDLPYTFNLYERIDRY